VVGLSKTYHDVIALDRVDLTVRPGRVHGLVGPNGAGKSTLMAALLGLIEVDAATLELDGVPLRMIRHRVPGGIAGAVEEARFYPYLTAAANLEVLAGLDDPGGLTAGEALEQVGLGGRANSKVAGFSMGMRARLGVAACLMRAPSLLVLDEPTSGLDPGVAADLLLLLHELAASDVSVILSSHDLVTVADSCDDVTVLVEGSVVVSSPMTVLAGMVTPRFILHTSDDLAARAVALAGRAVEVDARNGRLVIAGSTDDLDELMLTLAADRIAVRRLELCEPPLRTLFDELTSGYTARSAEPA